MRTFLRIIPVGIALVLGFGQVSQAAPDQKNDINKHFNKAIQYSKARKWKSAVDEYKIVLKMQPGSVPANTNLGVVYASMGQHNNAEIAFKRVIAAEPKNERVLEQLVSVLAMQGKRSEALTFARKLMELKPKNERYISLYGSIQMEMKEYTAAADAFRSVIHMNPKNQKAYVNLGYCYLNTDPPSYVNALETMELLLKIDPKNVQARMTAAYAAEMSKDKTTAIKHYEAASAGKAAEQALFNLSRLYKEVQQPEKSVNALKRIVKVNKNHFDANFNLGAYEYGKSNWKAAESYWLAARKAQPNEPTVNLNLAMVMARQNRFKEAQNPAALAFKGQPGNPVVLEGYGYILESNGHHEKALDVYKQWEKVAPGNAAPNTKMAALYLTLARKAQMEQKDAAKEKSLNLKACGQYSAAIEKDPKNADLIGEYAEALNSLKETDKAQKQYKSALALKPDSDVLLLKYTNFLREQKKQDEAIAFLTDTVEKYPKEESIRLLLAQELRDKKENTKAIEAYSAALVLNPKSENALRALAGLYTEEKQHGKLVEVCRKLVGIDANNTYYSMALADALDKNNESEAALIEYNQLSNSETPGVKIEALQRMAAIQQKLKKTDDAVATYKQIIDSKPGNISALSSLARIYEEQNKTDEHLAYLKSLVDAGKPDCPYKYIAQEFIKAGKANDVIPSLEALYAKSPNVTDIAYVLGEAYVAGGQIEKAVSVYNKVISVFVEDRVANRELGFIYFGQGKKQEAYGCLTIAFKQGALSGKQLLDYAKLCEELNKATAAKNAYSEYLKYNPADTEVKKKIGDLESATPPAETTPESVSPPTPEN